ncbi:unnamed protein product [Oikopleura dioica]|uniref:Uncharacterized protein n=1 Tax=Oikopleura dioica TaxID=34765 RepID=E4XPL2_OIKDI|nr:unnamed protein product [Oikopleura dioica]
MKISCVFLATVSAQETVPQRIDTAEPGLFDILIAQKTGLQFTQIYATVEEEVYAAQRAQEEKSFMRRGPRLLSRFVALKNFANEAFEECHKDEECLESCYKQLIKPNGEAMPTSSSEILSRFASVSDCLTSNKKRRTITRKSLRLAEKFSA